MKSRHLLPTSIVASALILVWAVSTHNNTLLCKAAYSVYLRVLNWLTKPEDRRVHRRAVEYVRATGCNDKWTRARRAAK